METNKEELKKAYEAGIKSLEQNADRNKRLEQGVKQIEEEYNFDNWYGNNHCEGPKWENIKSFKLLLGVIG